MKIKLHNSMLKRQDYCFLFDNKVSFIVHGNIRFTYRIEDTFFFLSFNNIEKEFNELTGFGLPSNTCLSKWWTDACREWEDIS